MLMANQKQQDKSTNVSFSKSVFTRTQQFTESKKKILCVVLSPVYTKNDAQESVVDSQIN